MKRWLHNFVCGAGTLVDLMPPPLPPSTVGRRILAESDAEAFYGDWQKIGADFRVALGQAEAELTTNGNGCQPTRPEPSDARPAA